MKPCTTSSSMNPAWGAGGDKPCTRSSPEPRWRRWAPRWSCCNLHRSEADLEFTDLAGAHRSAVRDDSGVARVQISPKLLWSSRRSPQLMRSSQIGGGSGAHGACCNQRGSGSSLGSSDLHKDRSSSSSSPHSPFLSSLFFFIKIVHRGQIWQRVILNF